MEVTCNRLSEWTGITRRVIKKRLDSLTPVGKGPGNAILWESREALPLIYAPAAKVIADNGSGNWAEERARLAKEQADGQALKNAKDRGELIPASKVAETWGRIVTAAKLQFLALPDRLSQLLETAKSIDDRRALIDAEVKTILVALSDDKDPDLKPLKAKPKRKAKKKTKPKKKKTPAKRKPAAKKKVGKKKAAKSKKKKARSSMA